MWVMKGGVDLKSAVFGWFVLVVLVSHSGAAGELPQY